MTSIHTNVAATAALQTLRSIASSMETVQNRVSSGFRVDSAADNAAYWSIATTMRSDNRALSAVEDALSLSAAKVDVAYNGMEASVEILDEIKSRFVVAREPGVDRSKVWKEISELKNQLLSVAQSSSFSGQNWLYLATPYDAANNTQDKYLVGGFTRDSNGLVSVQTIKLDFRDETQVAEPSDTWAMFDFMTGHIGDLGIATSPNFAVDAGFTNWWVLFKSPSPTVAGYPAVTEMEITSSTTDTDLDEMIVVVDAMLQYTIEKAANYGAVKGRIDMQSDFAKSLSQSIDMGVGRLVDANMNEESSRLKALQTQQQLGLESLSIANSNAQTLLTLFS
ncbi:MAG: flagellin [Hoeflea sp.]|uniref:flagellin N-terminal helical domain-containing protein n=1 Tax=Hoeflea sp. TaxID=1940281 RepID=UPI0027307773|nr:flagellin [Hoeflea sp.]MDP2118920.1 flagellin [Hoeflea sp.]